MLRQPHLRLHHLLLEQTALRIGAVEDGEVAVVQPLLLAQPLDLTANDGGLALIRDGLPDDDLLALGIAAEYVFVNLLPVVLHQ